MQSAPQSFCAPSHHIHIYSFHAVLVKKNEAHLLPTLQNFNNYFAIRLPPSWTDSCHYYGFYICIFCYHFTESPLISSTWVTFIGCPQMCHTALCTQSVLWNNVAEGFSQVLRYENEQVISTLSIVLWHFLGDMGYSLHPSKPHISNL